MVAITGPRLTRRAESVTLVVTALAALATVLVPALYAVLLPATCAAMAVAAPRGRRAVSAMAVWVPMSTAVVVGTLGVS